MRATWRACVAAVALVALVGCRSPTQIDVVVTTNVPCAKVDGTSLTSGTLGAIERVPATTTSATCSGTHLGSVVLVPSGDDDELVGFKVVTAVNGQSVDQCTPDEAGSYGANCIVARRALRYVPHTPLTVNVLMSTACAGTTCDPLRTCVEGACVPATIGSPTQCEGNGCGEGVLAEDGGTPGGPDATAPADAGFDATLPPVGDGATDAASDAASDAPAEGAAPFDAGPPGTVPGCDMGGAQAGAAWPMEDYCPTHRNRSPLVGPVAAPHFYWSANLPGHALDAPSIGADGTVYIGGAGVLEALKPSNGGVIWQYSAPGAIFQTLPLLAADHTVRALDLNGSYVVVGVDGSAPVSSGFAYSVRGGMTVIADGTLYASDTSAGNLLSFNAAGQVALVEPHVSNDYVMPTVTSDGTILTATNAPDGGPTQYVYATWKDGGARWASATDASQQAGSVAVAVDGTLRLGSPNEGILYALTADGAPLWSVRTPVNESDSQTFAIADDGTTYVGGDLGIQAFTGAGADAGAFTGSACWQPVLDAAGNVYDWCGGFLYKFDARLQTQWQVAVATTEGQILNDSPVLGPGGMIYLAFDTENTPDGGPPDEVLAYGP